VERRAPSLRIGPILTICPVRVTSHLALFAFVSEPLAVVGSPEEWPDGVGQPTVGARKPTRKKQQEQRRVFMAGANDESE
jgi:hypothetical protein